MPWPISVIWVFSVDISQYFPFILYGASLFQISRTILIDSTNISFRSFSRFPNTSASDASPPGLIPKLNLPSSIWSSIAIWPAIAAGWEFGILTVPVPRRIFFVSAAKEAMNNVLDVMFSAESVTCSPQ